MKILKTFEAPTLKKSAINQYSKLLSEAPLVQYTSPAHDFQAIPAALKAMVYSKTDWNDLRREGGLILSGLDKVASWIRNNMNSQRYQMIFQGLKGMEREASLGLLEPSSGIATCRLDLFFENESAKVIEINTTIPAMQAYSDMVKRSYLSALAGSEVELQESNSKDLLFSLLQHYEESGGKSKNPSIAIVSRPHDSQLAELRWLQREWGRLGYDTILCHPEDVALDAGKLKVSGQTIDIFYRHIFAYRLDPQSTFARACRESRKYKVFNPISAHLEAKGLMAELSRLSADANHWHEIGLTEEEREAVNDRVIWSRLLMDGDNVGPGGDAIKDLAKWVEVHKNELVIKSSLGYGGQGVFFGSDFESEASQSRLQKVLGQTDPINWSTFVKICNQSHPGQWIVQKKMEGKKITTPYVINGETKTEDVYIDSSIFLNTGVSFKPNGGTCRFSRDTIVNLGKGGGLIPFLSEEELTKFS